MTAKTELDRILIPYDKTAWGKEARERIKLFMLQHALECDDIADFMRMVEKL